MKIKALSIAVICLCWLLVLPASGEDNSTTVIKKVSDNPAEVIKKASDMVQKTPAVQETPEQRWQNYLQENGWDAGAAYGGVIFIPERNLVISSAVAYTKVRLGQPGWVESRTAAFEKAEMDAKAKIIKYLGETMETKRSLSLFEKAQWDDGEINKVKKLNEVRETLKRIGKKSLELAEKTLDRALQKLDPDYDPAKYEGKTVPELQKIAEDMFNKQVKTVAMGTLIGITPVYTTEGSVGEGEYEVLMGVIWSPKLNRLAMSLFNDAYNIPKVIPPCKPLTQQIPANPLALLGTYGTRIVIDENGDYTVMAYAQAQPRRAAPGRRQAALHQAKQIAANRARAMLINFIREGMTLKESQARRELSQEFSDMTFGTETLRDYQKKIKSKRVKVKLSGLRVLKEWDIAHPATGQPVAGAVLAWSPASARLSKKAAETMRNSMHSGSKAGKVSNPAQKTNGSIPSLPPVKVDTSAY